MAKRSALPPGQFESREFPRFGLGKFARRFPSAPGRVEFAVRGDVAQELQIGEALAGLPRVEQTADFHCVTTWSVRALRWSGFRFADFYTQIVAPRARPLAGAEFVVFRGQDDYASIMMLSDLLAADVLLADRLDGQGLGVEHGAPLRLVAPAHYGYKSAKHLAAVEFWRDRRAYRFPFPYPRFMDHPRARVALEERGVGVPAWLLRFAYRALIPSTKRNFRRALDKHRTPRGDVN